MEQDQPEESSNYSDDSDSDHDHGNSADSVEDLFLDALMTPQGIGFYLFITPPADSHHLGPTKHRHKLRDTARSKQVVEQHHRKKQDNRG